MLFIMRVVVALWCKEALAGRRTPCLSEHQRMPHPQCNVGFQRRSNFGKTMTLPVASLARGRPDQTYFVLDRRKMRRAFFALWSRSIFPDPRRPQTPPQCNPLKPSGKIKPCSIAPLSWPILMWGKYKSLRSYDETCPMSWKQEGNGPLDLRRHGSNGEFDNRRLSRWKSVAVLGVNESQLYLASIYMLRLKSKNHAQSCSILLKMDCLHCKSCSILFYLVWKAIWCRTHLD